LFAGKPIMPGRTEVAFFLYNWNNALIYY
jgi:hypothetical protein